MKTAWTVLIITAATDGVVTIAAALQASMLEAATGEMPGLKAIIAAVLGGLVIAARTIQQELKKAVERGAAP